jgi:DNA invertase Pin-like site-specific DNA recombinase
LCAANFNRPDSRPPPPFSAALNRDSGGKHEKTPPEYIRWAGRRAVDLGVRFAGTPESIVEMIHDHQPVSGDIFFDYCEKGNELSRPALNALREAIRRDPTISHVFIPRRDRLARPDDPADGIRIEGELRLQGVTIVFMDKMLGPRQRGRRPDLAEGLEAWIDYDQSGRYRTTLAEKMIFAQLRLAQEGYSTGGRAPFGFRRALVREDGTVVRQLADGEVVRQGGHHVVWIPGPDDEIEIIRRILVMLEMMPASRVARELTNEKIPSPDAGRCRKDQGVRHLVSGSWHQSTIINIARNKLLVAVATYGKRSMGDQRRMSVEGPRELDDSDHRNDGKPKVVRNPDEVTITAHARFKPLISPEAHQHLLTILDARAGTQRGKPRSRNPEENPLGGRIFDLECRWPMYRVPRGKSFRYTCGYYQQSHCQECHHNHVDGTEAARFVLTAIRQRMLKPGMLERLEEKLRQRAAMECVSDRSTRELTTKQSELAVLRSQLDQASQNLALASNPAQFKAISAVFDELNDRLALLAAEVGRLEQAVPQPIPENEVAAALRVLQHLTDLAKDSSSLGDLGRLFSALNVQLFLRFQAVQKTKRVEQKLGGGVLTFGAAPPPIEKYAGPTGRRALAGRMSPANAEVIISGEEEQSSGNVSRGDRI